MKKLVLCVLAAVLGGCANVKTSQQALELIVHHDQSTQLAGCERLGPLYTDTTGNIMNFDDVAEVAFREQALQRYGSKVDNLVLINRRALPAGRIILQGMAYSCYK